MPNRSRKKAFGEGSRIQPDERLRRMLAKQKKSDLIDVLIDLAQDDNRVLRRLTARVDPETSPEDLEAFTRQAIVDATRFERGDINYNCRYDHEAYEQVQRNLSRLIELGRLRVAMKLLLDLMEKGSYQVEMSDEGLMTEDIESCIEVVMTALAKGDIPANEVRTWVVAMRKRDRVGFICDKMLTALSCDIEATQADY